MNTVIWNTATFVICYEEKKLWNITAVFHKILFFSKEISLILPCIDLRSRLNTSKAPKRKWSKNTVSWSNNGWCNIIRRKVHNICKHHCNSHSDYESWIKTTFCFRTMWKKDKEMTFKITLFRFHFLLKNHN